MKILRASNEDEMVLSFLNGELNSERFKADLLNCLKILKTNMHIITNANLNNEKENQLRKQILAKYRGYGENSGLFENFPHVKKYSLCTFSHDDLKNIFYINYSYWNELSNHTSSPIEAAKNIKIGKTFFDVSNNQFIKGAQLLKSGITFEPMIFLTYDYSSFIILEGHSRITIYALQPENFKNINAFVLECPKNDILKWNSWKFLLESTFYFVFGRMNELKRWVIIICKKY